MSSRSPFANAQARRINHTIGQAIHQYDMIADGDRIAVAISGGYDSLTLLWFLLKRLPRIPVRYELLCIHIDPGFENGFASVLEQYIQSMNIDIKIDYTNIGIIAHGPDNRENPCFLCAKLRRKRIFEIAQTCSCNKVALGHNKDDLIETMMINMFYAGEISCMHPMQSFFNGKFTLIRPLAYTDSTDIRRFAKKIQLPEFINPCPSAKNSKRSDIRDMLNTFYKKTKNQREPVSCHA
ncbi:MAG: PP-loop domain-containing protein [Candidatus Magnetoglobus multicellularis str. Araruama]|uniref:PP-loop domain-containing protein n=1 Tax=Candidatus Magnetoglobus multicellularis str. Araruama TaxID=890399 RepID=A0A1V1PE86_9BACT|nr:MAG: PP-loop domain-containing protein [Candidatus Magnetoglobus multicellularis str. Araruama]